MHGRTQAWVEEELAAPLNPAVVEEKEGMSYLPVFYVRQELNRIFGASGWRITLRDNSLINLYEVQSNRGGKEDKKRRVMVYRAHVTLRVRFPDGEVVEHDGVAAGGAQSYSPFWEDLHHNAMTSASSNALKRAAMNLGNAFGLSLYDGKNPVHMGGWDTWAGYAYPLTPTARHLRVLNELGLDVDEVNAWIESEGWPAFAHKDPAEFANYMSNGGMDRFNNFLNSNKE